LHGGSRRPLRGERPAMGGLDRIEIENEQYE
jgi:hypothetical protein